MNTNDGVAAVRTALDVPRKRPKASLTGGAEPANRSFTGRPVQPVHDELNPSVGVYDTAGPVFQTKTFFRRGRRRAAEARSSRYRRPPCPSRFERHGS